MVIDRARAVLLPHEAESADVGGKARALARAAGAGLPVPPWIVVTTRAFDRSVAASGAAPIPASGEASTLPWMPDRLDAALMSELDAQLRSLSPHGELLAVRSSASDEDGAQHSFAGQLESYLSVPPEHVCDRVRDVWRSGFTPRIVAYRREHGLPPLPRPPAVLIQRMVDARAAGVAFSADPVTGRRGVAVVSAVHGCGSALVSGEAEADTWTIDRRGRILERRVVAKERRHVLDPAADGGVRTEPVPESDAIRPAVSDAEAIAVAELARRAARYFHRPQDIEWAFEGDRLWLLQSRPITSIAGLPDPDATLLVWDNSNIVESYSGVTTPMTFSFTSEIYEHVYRQFCRLLGVPERLVAAHDETFRNMLGLIRGRLYYNLLNWYRVLALLPGFSTNRRFMEQMMGVKEPLPEDAADRIAAAARTGRIRDVARVMRAVLRLVFAAFTIGGRVRTFTARLDEALAPPDPPLEDRRPDELVAHYRDLRARLLLRWDAPIVNDFLAMVAYGTLRSLTVRWLGDAGGTLQNDLVGGAGGMVSAEPAIRLQQLARLAAGDPSLVETLLYGTTGDALAAINRHAELRAGYDAYLERFGERTVNELKLESETLHDDPSPLVRGIGGFARQLASGSAGSSSAGERLRADARVRAGRALQGRPVRRIVFSRALGAAQARLRDRENLRLERTRLFGRVRRIFLELGRRLHALDVLDEPRDVFFLAIDEVLGFVEGRSITTDLRGLVALRRAEFASYAAGPAPDDRFETRGTVYHAHAFRRAEARATAGGEERKGLGCSPGLVRGLVRVVADPRTVDLAARTILVAEHTDPGWIMVFPSALGVLVERGSLLSHAAIVARELGIPAVVSIPGVTAWLRDGDEVEFDGSTGVIRRVSRAAGSVDA